MLLELVQVLSVCGSMLSELFGLFFESRVAIASQGSKSRLRSSDSIETQTDRTCTISKSTSKVQEMMVSKSPLDNLPPPRESQQCKEKSSASQLEAQERE